MATKKTNEIPKFFSKKVYEILRWTVAILLPGCATLIATLDNAWGWGLPMTPILATFSAFEVFVGMTFLGSKYASERTV